MMDPVFLNSGSGSLDNNLVKKKDVILIIFIYQVLNARKNSFDLKNLET